MRFVILIALLLWAPSAFAQSYDAADMGGYDDAGAGDVGDDADAGDPDGGVADGGEELEPVEPEPVEEEPVEPVEPEVVDEPIEEVLVEEELVEEDDPADLRVDTALITAEELARSGGAGNRKDEEELRELNYDDPSSQLQDVPAVYVRREDGFGLRPNIGIRGANSERSKKITLMEDGILFAPAPYSAPAAYYFPIVSRMVGIEVFKGPSAVRYGPHTVGGAVNWITRPVPYDTVAGVDLNFGSFLTGKLHSYFGTSWDHVGVLIEGVQWQSDGYKELDGGGPTGFNKSELMGKLRINSDLAAETFHALVIKLGYSRETSYETYLGLTDDDFRDTPNRRYAASALDKMDWDRLQGEARYRVEVGRKFDLQVTGYRHNYARVWEKLNRFGTGAPTISDVLANPTGSREVYLDILSGEADSADPLENLFIGRNDRRFVAQGVDVVANVHSKIGETIENRLRFGARVHHDRIIRLHTERGYAMESGELVAVDAAAVTTTNNRGSTIAYSAFVLDEFQFWRLVATPGLRVELIDGELEDLRTNAVAPNFQTALLPGIGLYGALTEHFGLLGGVHRGFSPESPGQPEGVAPETSVNYEAGARFSRPKSKSIVEVVGFFNDYRNLLGECSFAAGCDEAAVDDQFNAGAVWVYGLEAVAGHKIKAPKSLTFGLHGSYTFTASRFRTAFASSNPQFGEVEVGDELPYVPAHQTSLRLGVEWKSLTWNVAGTYVSPMREEAGQGDAVRTDEQFILDSLLSWEFFDGFTVYGKVDNALNQRPIVSRRPFGARPSRPLMLQAGLRWDY